MLLKQDTFHAGSSTGFREPYSLFFPFTFFFACSHLYCKLSTPEKKDEDLEYQKL